MLLAINLHSAFNFLLGQCRFNVGLSRYTSDLGFLAQKTVAFIALRFPPLSFGAGNP